MSRLEPAQCSPERLVYVLNQIGADDSHYGHTIHLLEEMAALGWNVTLVIERSNDQDRASIDTRSAIRYRFLRLPHVLRLVELCIVVTRLRFQGNRIFFTRISTKAAVIVGLLSWPLRFRSLFWFSTQGAFESADERTGWDRLRYRTTRLLPLRLAARVNKQFVTGPEAMRTYYVSEWQLVPDRKVVVLDNDVDCRQYRPIEMTCRPALRARLGFQPGDLVLVAVHRLSPVRKSALYFEHLAALPDLRSSNGHRRLCICVVGGGPELARLRSLYESTSPWLEFRFVGPVPRLDVIQYLHAADGFLMPSYAEGFPRVLLEALACALPIVATDAGGSSQVLGSSADDWVVGKSDFQGFAAKVIQLCNLSTGEIEELSEVSRARALYFDTTAVARRFSVLLLRAREAGSER